MSYSRTRSREGGRRERRLHSVLRGRSQRQLGVIVGLGAFLSGAAASASFGLISLDFAGDDQQVVADDVAPIAVEHDGIEIVVETEEVVLEPEKITKEDPYLLEGTVRVDSEGAPGAAVVSYDVTYEDGVEVSRVQTLTVVTADPINEVISEGTLVVPPTTKAQRGSNRELGQQMAAERGWDGDQWACLDTLWQRESNWNHLAGNPTSGAYGIPQSLPASKMKSAGDDYMTNPATQIKWGLGYISNRYGDPCGAWAHFVDKNWY